MATKIEWTDETFNPVTGCTSISAGCKNCYAKRVSRRLAGRYGYPEKPDHFNVTLHPDRLEQPLRWRKPRRVFVCSMGDLFHEDVPDEFIERVFATMEVSKRHTFQVLTKRPQRMLDFCNHPSGKHLPASNVWLGVTAENQQAADERIPLLLQTPAAVRFVSCEPLLGEIRHMQDYVRGFGRFLDSTGIDWVIAGGETGPGARPMHPDWARSLRDQCQRAGVPFFFKQFGKYVTIPHAIELGVRVARIKDVMNANTIGGGFVGVSKKQAGRLLDGQLWEQYPNH